MNYLYSSVNSTLLFRFYVAKIEVESRDWSGILFANKQLREKFSLIAHIAYVAELLTEVTKNPHLPATSFCNERENGSISTMWFVRNKCKIQVENRLNHPLTDGAWIYWKSLNSVTCSRERKIYQNALIQSPDFGRLIITSSSFQRCVWFWLVLVWKEIIVNFPTLHYRGDISSLIIFNIGRSRPF